MSTSTIHRLARRLLRFRPDPRRDTFLVSYPRSGNTWLRGIIFDLLLRRPPDSLREIDFAVPDIHYDLPGHRLVKQPFYVVKSHNVYRCMDRLGYRKVIYVVRDPRNVLASYRRYIATSRDVELPKYEFYRDILQGRYWPSSWYEHVVNWWFLDDYGERRTTKLRYEDLVGGDLSAWQAFGNALNLSIDGGTVTRLLDGHDLAATRQLESRGNRPNLEKGKIWFVGSGRSTDDEAEIIDQAITKYAPQMWRLMAELSYAERVATVRE